MYLYVWKTGESAVVSENFTPPDLLAVKAGILDIYKYIYGDGYYKLALKNKIVWERIRESKVAICNNDRLHN